jgi:hypothetical protein
MALDKDGLVREHPPLARIKKLSRFDEHECFRWSLSPRANAKTSQQGRNNFADHTASTRTHLGKLYN